MVKLHPANDAKLDRVFHALSDPTRRAILKRLTTKEQPVTEVAKPFHMSLPAVSKHIKVLEGARLVKRTRAGSYWFIRLDAAAMKHADKWLEDYRQFWEQSLDRLEEYLKNENKEHKNKKGR